MASADTRARLESAALDVLARNGVGGLSARAIANGAGVNQALIFYHYGTVLHLLDCAARASVEAAVERHRARFDASRSFGELLAAGRALHELERGAGSVAIMAQLAAGATHDEAVATTARHCLERWLDALDPVVERLVRASPLVGVLDPRGIARAVTAGFLGFELYEGIDPASATTALAALDQLGSVLEAVDDLGPVARRAIRARVRRRQR